MDALALERVDFIPAHGHPCKSAARAGQRHRRAMLELALHDHPRLAVNDIELRRGGISYTIDTLAELRNRAPRRPLCFIMGADAFASLPAWRRWRELADYAHLIIVDRKQSVDGVWNPRLRDHYATRSCSSPTRLRTQPGGFIHKAAVSVPDVSSSQIRVRLGRREDARDSLPPDVYDYIRENNLYV